MGVRMSSSAAANPTPGSPPGLPRALVATYCLPMLGVNFAMVLVIGGYVTYLSTIYDIEIGDQDDRPIGAAADIEQLAERDDVNVLFILVDTLRADRLGDHHGRRHAEPEHDGKHEEHDDIGVGGRGERLRAQETADPDGVDRAIQGLEDVGRQRRHGKEQQRRSDRPLRQVLTA